ncbi:hypothetical protein CUR95_24120 [Bordetella bronchiseptica]|nr:hypothetical protein [Bordetella bronchiseptica]
MNLHSYKVTVVRTETTVKSIELFIEAESAEDARTLAKYQDVREYQWLAATPTRTEATEIGPATVQPVSDSSEA